MRLKTAFLVVALVLACRSQPSSTMPDLAGADLAGAPADDLARAGDLAAQMCGACRTFSSYCDGCSCFALAANAPDPVCTGSMVSCFVDPCEGRDAICSSGVCTLQ